MVAPAAKIMSPALRPVAFVVSIRTLVPALRKFWMSPLFTTAVLVRGLGVKTSKGGTLEKLPPDVAAVEIVMSVAASANADDAKTSAITTSARRNDVLKRSRMFIFESFV